MALRLLAAAGALTVVFGCHNILLDILGNTNKEMTAFSFTMQANSVISADAVGTITGTTIAVSVPHGTPTSSLVATFAATGAAVTVSGTVQVSGTTANDFGAPVAYLVTALDGTTREYTVIVADSGKQIVSFEIASPSVKGSIDEGSHAISLGLAPGTAVTAMVAVFVTTGVSVTVAGVEQTSGVTANDFSSPVTYTVHAADGSTQDYVVSVSFGARMGGAVQGIPLNLDGEVSTVAGRASDIWSPTAVYADGESLFFADGPLLNVITLADNVTHPVAGSVFQRGSVDGPLDIARFSEVHDICRSSYLGMLDRVLCVADGHSIRVVFVDGGYVDTIAGHALFSGSADGVGSAARFSSPRGVSVDYQTLYVADTGNHTIRAVNLQSGTVSTLAGLAGASGSTDAIGTAARLSSPTGVAVVSGMLYVTDRGNNTIRRIDLSTSAVTTFAGVAGAAGSADGIGSAARFSSPAGLSATSVALYVADNANKTVRKVTIATAEVTTIAGQAGSSGSADGIGTTARFSSPQGASIGIPECDFLYVADIGNRAIRRIDLSTQGVVTIAGVPPANLDGVGDVAQLGYPTGVTTDGTSLYWFDALNYTVRKLALATGLVTTVAGQPGVSGFADGTGSAAQFAGGMATMGGCLTTDGTSLFFADKDNYTIRKIDIGTAEVTTFAGQHGVFGYADGIGALAQFQGPHGITSDGSSLFVTDYFAHTVRRIRLDTREVSTLAGQPGVSGTDDGIGAAARFTYPTGIVTDGQSLYVAETFSNTIRKIVISTREVTTIAGAVGQSGSTDGVGGNARFYYPGHLTTDGASLYIPDLYNFTIRKLALSTLQVTTIAGEVGKAGSLDGAANSARFAFATAITTDGLGLYVTDMGNNTIRRIR